MTRIAVVQPALELGEVARNLERIEDLIRDAHREHAPEVILLPEACTTPNVFAKVLRGTPRPVDGQPFQLLTRLARELDCVIGGGFVAVRGKHTYGTFVLAEPDGAVHLHDKDIPTAWEQHFYVGGDDQGVTRSVALGCEVGMMSGWEWARFRTSARVRARGARVVLGGHVLAFNAAQLARLAACVGRARARDLAGTGTCAPRPGRAADRRTGRDRLPRRRD